MFECEPNYQIYTLNFSLNKNFKLDLERMQKLQYKHEKEMLRQQAISHNKKTLNTKSDKLQANDDAFNIKDENKDEEEELSFSDQELLFENDTDETLRLKSKSNLEAKTPAKPTSRPADTKGLIYPSFGF